MICHDEPMPDFTSEPLELLIWQPEDRLSTYFRRHFEASTKLSDIGHHCELLADGTPVGEGCFVAAKLFAALIGATAFLGTCSASLSPRFLSSGWLWVAFTIIFALVILLGTAALVLSAAQSVWAFQHMHTGTWRFGIFLFDEGLVVRDRSRIVLALPRSSIVEFRSEKRRSERMDYWIALVDFYDDNGDLQFHELESPGAMSALQLVEKLGQWIDSTVARAGG